VRTGISCITVCKRTAVHVEIDYRRRNLGAVGLVRVSKFEDAPVTLLSDVYIQCYRTKALNVTRIKYIRCAALVIIVNKHAKDDVIVGIQGNRPEFRDYRGADQDIAVVLTNSFSGRCQGNRVIAANGY